MVKVLICGIVKDVEKMIEYNLKKVKELGNYFNEYKVVIYENNSTDRTKEILKKHISKNITVIMEDLIITKENSTSWAYTKVTGSDHSCRIENISNARNKVVEEINKEIYNDFDVVIWIDLDGNGFDIKSVVDSVNIVSNEDKILFANSPQYYDYYALRTRNIHSLFGPEIIGELFWSMASRNRLSLNHDYPLYEVFSAFNGIGIYPKKVFFKNNYDFIVNDCVKEMYKKLITILPENLSLNFNKIIENDCSKFPGGIKEDNIVWKNNSGYDKPVICEHVALNYSLVKEGYKLYINPKMMYYR
jgi:hypothetical protein